MNNRTKLAMQPRFGSKKDRTKTRRNRSMKKRKCGRGYKRCHK